MAGIGKWLKKEQLYDKDIAQILTEYKVEVPEDFKNITSKQWDEILRRGKVERFKELKDSDSRNRLDKKFKKIEKEWRKQSGIKATSITKSTNKASRKNSGNDEKEEEKKIKECLQLKKWMQKNEVWQMELFKELYDIGIRTDSDIEKKIKTNEQWDEIFRKVRVARNKDLKDSDAKARMENLMNKFEKEWRRRTGLKKTSQNQCTKNSKAKPTPKDEKIAVLENKGYGLKQWMKKKQIFEMSLFGELLKHDIEDEETLKGLSQVSFDNIIRIVRVDRFKELKDSDSRARCDKLLVSFEKEWRAASGIKSTSITENQK